MFWFFVLCLWSGQCEFMALFMVFDLWFGAGFIFEPCSSFFNSHFPVPPLGPDQLEGVCLNKVTVYVVPSD